MLESARGVGMNERQVFSRVQLPLAAPVIVSGVRTAAVEIIASATLAAFVGVGGLGRFITSGLTLYDFSILLVGAVPVALLALLAEATLAGVERLCTPPARPSWRHFRTSKIRFRFSERSVRPMITRRTFVQSLAVAPLAGAAVLRVPGAFAQDASPVRVASRTSREHRDRRDVRAPAGARRAQGRAQSQSRRHRDRSGSALSNTTRSLSRIHRHRTAGGARENANDVPGGDAGSGASPRRAPPRRRRRG